VLLRAPLPLHDLVGYRRLQQLGQSRNERAKVEPERAVTGLPWDFMIDRANGLAYVRITWFADRTPVSLKRVIDRLLKAASLKGLILDLRFCPGGSLPSAIWVADLFIENGVIVTIEEGKSLVPCLALAKGTYHDLPVAVLVNRYTAGAAEIVAAALQDHERSPVIGERTRGLGSVKQTIDLTNRAPRLTLTVADCLRPSGRGIHRFGNMTEDDEWDVRPDQESEVTLTRDETVSLAQRLRSFAGESPGKRAEERQDDVSDFAIDRQLCVARERLLRSIESSRDPQ
jgi:carboxyl-terminal processing protease